MTAEEAIKEAGSRGLALTPVGTILRLRGPEDALDEELQRELKRHKPEILALLRGDFPAYPCVRCETFAFHEADTVCYWCRKVRREA